MRDYITIKHETFTATLNLREVHQLTVPQWRRLLKLAVRQLWDNAGNLRLAMEWLEEAGIPGARDRVTEAEKDIDTDTWPTKGLSPDEREAARRHNAWLNSRLAEAKKRVQQLEKLRTILTETVPEDDLEYCLNNY